MAAQQPRSEEQRKRIAERLRGRYLWLNKFNDDELREISMCELEEGDPQSSEMYFDLSHPERGAFQGQRGKVVPDGSCYVGKDQVSGNLWNKLVSFHRGMPTMR